MVFEAQDKEVFRKIMRNLEAFMGVRVVTYCLMTNHFHLLVEVPDKEEMEPLTEAELLRLLPVLHDSVTAKGVEQELDRARASGSERWQAEILARYEKRRGDLSFFLKELKQRVTLYMNKRLNRRGTLWEGRYKSVLVEGNEQALLTIAAYIDLNPVRAGMVESPEDYRWCGYAEALSGGRGARQARQGLGTILCESLQDSDYRADWRRTQNRYRLFLFTEAEERSEDVATGTTARRGVSEHRLDAVVKAQGSLPVRDVLRHRVRYFCDGAILGTAEFVNEVFARERERGRYPTAKRETGARKMRGAKWGELRVLRDLQVDVIG